MGGLPPVVASYAVGALFEPGLVESLHAKQTLQRQHEAATRTQRKIPSWTCCPESRHVRQRLESLAWYISRHQRFSGAAFLGRGFRRASTVCLIQLPNCCQLGADKPTGLHDCTRCSKKMANVPRSHLGGWPICWSEVRGRLHNMHTSEGVAELLAHLDLLPASNTT